MNTIQLKGTIPVRTFDAHATVAIFRERPEWLAVAWLAKDFGGEIDVVTITKELLGGVPPVVGRRVISRCVGLGLLEQTEQQRTDGTARLSALGAAAVEKGQVPVPEERNWRFYLAEDPLVVQPVLHVEPLDDGSAKAGRDGLSNDRKSGQRRPNDGESCPASLRAARESNAVLPSVAEGRPSFMLTAAPDAGVSGDEQSLMLELRWVANGQPELVLVGQLDRPPRQSRKQGTEEMTPAMSPLMVRRVLEIPEALSSVTHERVWMALAALGTGRTVEELEAWRQRARRLVLPVRFAGLDAGALNTFRKDVSVPGTPKGWSDEMRWLEGFDPSTLSGVELVPATDPDAQQWADWLLRESLKDYATPVRLAELTDATRRQFEFHSPTLPTPEEMLAAALGKPADTKSRFILAPHDLGLWS